MGFKDACSEVGVREKDISLSYFIENINEAIIRIGLNLRVVNSSKKSIGSL